MNTWEYKNVTVNMKLWEHELNELGKVGWELVSYEVIEGRGWNFNTYTYIFKRKNN